MPAAVEVRDVSKKFVLHHDKYSSLKERVINLGRQRKSDFWALRDVEFDIAQGETFGLLGHNGSGKSTLLKCIAGIMGPSEGAIRTRGRLAALLELGAGFHPDLTGRENVFINAAIFGIAKSEVERQFDAIVDFAELEDFIDEPVKHYSSGMYVRLGFAVAIHMDPDVLLVDEVLSVGDEAFQAKCLGRVRQLQAEGRTIVVVSHAADVIRQTCDRAGVLDHGRLLMTGPPGEAVRALRETLFLRQTAAADDDTAGPSTGAPLRIRGIDLDFPQRGERSHLLPGDPLEAHVGYQATRRIEDPVVSFAIYDQDDQQLFGTNTRILGHHIPALEGRGVITFRIEHVPFLDGEYFVSAKVTDDGGGTVYDWRARRDSFEVVNPGQATGSVYLPVSVTVDETPVPEEATP